MHPEQNEREATIDTEDEKTICERKKKIKKTNERTNERKHQTQQVVFAFLIFVKSKRQIQAATALS